jgi:tetratricopeptide (TPR) repeat protein
MSLFMPTPGPHSRHVAELRLFIVSTSAETGPERAALTQTALPEFRRRSGERGVTVTEADPRWEAATEPGKEEEIFADRINEMHAHRPLFIGILGSNGPADIGGSPFPRLADNSGPALQLMGIDFIARVLDNELMSERAFFYILGEAPGSTGNGRSEAARRIGELRERLRGSDLRVREVDGIESLCVRVQEDLLAMIDQLHPAGGNLSPLEQLRRPHELFAARLRRAYADTPRYFDQLDASIRDGIPMMVTGRSGDGKSALLANWAEDRRRDKPGVPIICHHVGVASVRSDHGTVLRHLMAELKDLCVISLPIPETIAELTEAFPSWLAQVGHERLVIVIDGLDALDPASHDLAWFPGQIDIPANVRIIVSTIHDEEPGRSVHHLLIDREWEELCVKPLTVRQQQSIISDIVAEGGIDIGPELLRGLRLGGDASSPLLIRIGAAQIRNSGSEQERIALLSARNSQEFFTIMFEQIEGKRGETFVRDVMSLLWGSRAGLTREELCRLTGSEAGHINELLGSAGHYLVEQDGLWSFIHNRVREVVERRYIPDEATGVEIHRRLARYFGDEPASARRAGEEPWQWEQAGDRHALAASLAGMEMFMVMSEEDRRHELRGYWVWLDDEELMAESYARSFEQWSADGEIPISERGTVAERLGSFFFTSGRPDIAERYLRLALELFRASEGKHGLKAAHAMHSMAELFRSTGEFAEADALYREALAILERESPDDGPAIAQLLSDLGLLCRDAGHHGSALPFYRRALDLKERIHGPSHPATAELLNDLALLYQDLHEFDQAIPLYERALEIRERRLGPTHPAVATTLNNLAGTVRDKGEFEAAEAYYTRALGITEKMLGRDHPITRVTITNLATLFQQQKKFGRASSMFERLITGTRLSEEHPDILGINISYALMLAESGKHEAAETLFRRTLATILERLGPLHPYTGYCYNNFAQLLRRMGREPESGPLFEGAIRAWKASWGPDHPAVSGPLQALAMVRFRGGDPESARHMLYEAIAIREKHFGASDPQTLETRGLLKRIDESGT